VLFCACFEKVHGEVVCFRCSCLLLAVQCALCKGEAGQSSKKRSGASSLCSALLLRRSAGFGSRMLFERAASLVRASERGWQSLVGRADSLSDEERAFVYFVDLYGDFSFLSNEENHPLEHVRTLWIGGHTHDHLALFYENGPQKFLMAGDVIGSKKALMRKYRAVYDADAEQGMEVREELKQLAWKEQYTILAYHETDSPMMRLSQWSPRSGYSIEVITV